MKGICFKEPLFHATIKGWKGQTRRIIDPQPYHDVVEVYGRFFNGVAYSEREIKPRYRVGEVIFLKEPYYTIPKDTPPFSESDRYLYAYGWEGDISPMWKNKLFMPMRAARHFIKITAVRAERLQDISNEDCMKEGIFSDALRCNFGLPNSNRTALDTILGKSFREAYAALIDKVNGRDTWDSNPVVWVYDYELHSNDKK